jgi:ankyrin repeat protein
MLALTASTTDFFNGEVTELLGRNLRLWNEKDLDACLDKAPRAFVVRLLEAYIGEHPRGRCEFAERMHSVLDILMEQLELVRTPKERHEVLHSVCYALAARPWQRNLFAVQGWTTTYWHPMPVVFVVALIVEYDHVVKRILSAHADSEHKPSTVYGISCKQHGIISVEAWYFGTPLDVAITLGRTAQVKMLLSHGTTFNETYKPWNCRGSSLAAQRGHKDVLDLLIGHRAGRLDFDTLQASGQLMAIAAAFQQWGLVRSMLDRHDAASRSRIERGYWNRILRFAAKYGQDRIVADVLPFATLRTTTGKLPLIEAAGGGHFSTCKFLLEEDALPDRHDLIGRAEEIARSVAIGGNVDVYRLLRDLDLWKPSHEVQFLPIAAEHGHLEFAKSAIEHSCDEKANPKQRRSIIPDLDRRVRYPDDIRYFALLRAIVSGHLDVVRWLVEEVGVNVGEDAELVHSGLCPMDLAVYSKNEAMVSLLVDLEVNTSTAGCAERCVHCQRAAAASLETYRNALFLRDDYSSRWCVSKHWGPLELIWSG